MVPSGGQRVVHIIAQPLLIGLLGLPLVDDSVNATHPRLRELRDLLAWCEAMVWSSPERVNLSAAT